VCTIRHRPLSNSRRPHVEREELNITPSDDAGWRHHAAALASPTAGATLTRGAALPGRHSGRSAANQVAVLGVEFADGSGTGVRRGGAAEVRQEACLAW